jgi:nitroreductase
MDVFAALTSRKVARNFAQRPVELDKLKLIVDAGRHAMSAMNLQPWQFIIVTDRVRLRSIASHCSSGAFVADAPAAIVVIKGTSAKNPFIETDCAQAVQNIANAAWALGLGTCWVGFFEEEPLARMLGVPKDWKIFTILPIGYPDPAVPPKRGSLRPRSQTVHFEAYGRQEP